METVSVKNFWLCIALLLLLSGCGSDGEVRESKQQVEPYRVIMMLARGGLGDRSFSDAAYAGLKEAMVDRTVQGETVQFVSRPVNEGALVSKIEQGVDLVIGIGYENKDTIAVLADKYPDLRFGIIDTVIAGKDNVTSVTFREEEGDFLMGALAAKLTKSGQIGFIGGVDIPVIRRIEKGFIRGVHHINADIVVTSCIVGSFNDIESGKLLALDMYADGADIIYAAAGRTTLGVVEAAGNSDGFVMGASGDHRNLSPGSVIGNRPKNVGKAVRMVIDQARAGASGKQVISLGLREGGIVFGPFADWALANGVREEMVELQAKVLSGELPVH